MGNKGGGGSGFGYGNTCCLRHFSCASTVIAVEACHGSLRKKLLLRSRSLLAMRATRWHESCPGWKHMCNRRRICLRVFRFQELKRRGSNISSSLEMDHWECWTILMMISRVWWIWRRANVVASHLMN